MVALSGRALDHREEQRLLGELVFPTNQDARHAALTHDEDAISQRQSVADLGRRYQEGAAGVSELPERREEVRHGANVDAGGRFIDEIGRAHV